MNYNKLVKANDLEKFEKIFKNFFIFYFIGKFANKCLFHEIEINLINRMQLEIIILISSYKI